jgi:NAD(P)H-flavin reductase
VAEEPRALAPPARRTGEVSGGAKLGAYDLLHVRDVEGPVDPRPGQFYMLASAVGWGGGGDERPYLPRAFSFARVRDTGHGSAELLFVLEQVGPGTRRLAKLQTGEEVTLVGPLGVGFRPPEPGTRPLLVGGGIGVAPLLCLHEELCGAGADGIELMLGFRSAQHARVGALFSAGEHSPGEPTIVTDDGSAGRRALVTAPLADSLERDTAATVYACGPPPMLEAVRALCAERAVPAQLALESGMACGFGACFGCVAPTRDGFVRICVDGPVLDASALDTAMFAGAGHSS